MIHVHAIHLPDIDDAGSCARLVERLLPPLTAAAGRNTPPVSSSQPVSVSVTVSGDSAFPSVFCSPEWEIARIRRFRHPADQLRALVGTLLLRSGVAQVSGHWPMVYRTSLGKPVAQLPTSNQEQVSHVPVSISHTGPWVIACFASDQGIGRIGIDITSLDSGHCAGARDTLEMYSPLLSAGERQWIADSPADLCALRRFASCWTVKEAVLKCLGSGLTGALEPLQLIEQHPRALPSMTGEWQTVNFVDQERLGHLPIPPELLPTQSLHVQTTQIDHEHSLSLAVEPSDGVDLLTPCPQLTVLTVEELIDGITQSYDTIQ